MCQSMVNIQSVIYFFGFYKTRHILLSNSANCTVLRAVVLTCATIDNSRYTTFTKSVLSTTPSKTHVYTTRSCTGRVQGTVWVVYTTVYGPCRWPVYTAVYVHGPCKRSPLCAMKYATCDKSALYDLRQICIVYDAVEETRVTVYTVVYRPCPRHSVGRVRSHLRAV